MDGLLHMLFAAAVLAAAVLGLITGSWDAALGLGIAWAFLTLLDGADR